MNMRTLLIESEQLVADMIRVNMENAGCEFEWVSDASHAIELIADGGFDLIVMGVDLGAGDELEQLPHLRKEALGIPLMVLTSGGDVKARARVLELGADDYLHKPFDMTEFMARTTAMVKRHGKV